MTMRVYIGCCVEGEGRGVLVVTMVEQVKMRRRYKQCYFEDLNPCFDLIDTGDDNSDLHSQCSI